MTDLVPPPGLAETVPGPTRDNVQLEASSEFVLTPSIQNLTDRALTYLGAGSAIHLSGTSGTGKTTLAFHIASQLGRQVVMMHGDEELAGSDLTGRGSGYRRSRVVDNFIHSVIKTEDEITTQWVDNRLTTACQHGYTLIYDEFNRSRPEANSALLSVLSEGILNLPRRLSGTGYVSVHPAFRAIFTSNTEEYVGVYTTQNALMGRLVTIRVAHHDCETEVQIVCAKSGIAREDAEQIVDFISQLRGPDGHEPSLRAAITLAKSLQYRNAHATPDDPWFVWACQDILGVPAAHAAKAARLSIQHNRKSARR
ncbi:gas vesicle protein GvpN [Ralstonia chuxiongensis]|uniref:gas vesicle protein GvpN n=1 Tax=Ralstonia chuxiongensis TaxID=2957504 RepID=UPI0028F4DCA6|nr:gas vesicle protein GvpN [Ralstonia chuxiongensis]CAJ0779942.1 hypothetical protein R8510_04680 [Ralstonia chuxiongensis]